jgi:hypothetical protein
MRRTRDIEKKKKMNPETLGQRRRPDTTTLPLENDAASEYPKKAAELLEFKTGERFGECVRNHVVSRTVE